MIWANHVYTHLDGEKETWYPEGHQWKTQQPGRHTCDIEVFRRVTDRLIAAGGNLLLVEMDDSVLCPHRPEIACAGAWTPEQMNAEVKRLKARGLEVVPMVNFSTNHDTWLKDYNRMLGTPTYYDVCRDVIGDLCAIFDRPKYFHIGLDEEISSQSYVQKGLLNFRRGRAYWHDVRFYADCCEKCGARPWMWADQIIDGEKEFAENCPKSIVQSAWYYYDLYEKEPTNRRGFEREHWRSFEKLERAGFDQIPTGTSWVEDKANELTNPPPYRNQFGHLVEHLEGVVSKRHLLGFLQTTWYPLLPGPGCEGRNMTSIEDLEVARKKYEAKAE